MALSIDANVSNDTGGAAAASVSVTVTTAHAPELLLALCVNGSGTPGSPTITGGGLTWNVLQNASGQAADNTSILYAWATSILTSQTITLSYPDSNPMTLTILSFTGMDTTSGDGSSAIGAKQTGGAASSTPSVSLTTTRNNSWVFGCIGLGANVTMTAGSNQTILHQAGDTVNIGHEATIKQNATTPTSGTSVPISVTNTNQAWNGQCVEILPASVSQYYSPLATLGVG